MIYSAHYPIVSSWTPASKRFSYHLSDLWFLGEKSQALLAFSFYTNGKKLLSYKKVESSDTLNCLHGIRVISTAWVVLGHTFSLYLALPIQNKTVFFSVSWIFNCQFSKLMQVYWNNNSYCSLCRSTTIWSFFRHVSQSIHSSWWADF